MTFSVNNPDIEELIHSIGASFVLIVIYSLCLYIAEPIANIIFLWYLARFAPATGHSVTTIIISQMVLRAILAAICSGYFGYLAGRKIFQKQNTKHTLLLSAVLVVLVPVMLLGIGLNARIKQMGDEIHQERLYKIVQPSQAPNAQKA